MTDSNDDLDNPSEDFEEAFEVQDGGSAGDFEPAEAPSAPESFGEEEPIDGGPADEDPLDDLELELGAELDQIVKPKQEFTIGGDDEYDSIESESVASAPKRSAEEEEARQRARARAERNRLRRLAEREEAAAQEEEEPPPQRQRRRAPPRSEVDEQRRRAEVQRKARQKEIAMNRRIVTGSYDDDDEQPDREYRGDGEWDTSYRRRKPRSAAMIVGITLASLLLLAALITGGVFGYLWLTDKSDETGIETAAQANPRSPRSAPSFDEEDDEFRPQSPSQLEDEMISKSELLRASGSVLRAIMNRLDTIRTELDRIDESRRRIDDAFLDIEEFLTEIQNERVRNDRDERRRSGRDSRKAKRKRKRNN